MKRWCLGAWTLFLLMVKFQSFHDCWDFSWNSNYPNDSCLAFCSVFIITLYYHCDSLKSTKDMGFPVHRNPHRSLLSHPAQFIHCCYWPCPCGYLSLRPLTEPPHSLSQLHGTTFSGFIILWLTFALLGLFPTCSISFTHSLTQQLLTTHYIPGTRIQQWAEMDMVLVLMENKAEWGKQAFIFNSMPYPVSSHHGSHTHDLSRSVNLHEHPWTPTFMQMC